MAGSRALRFIQIGKETTAGTAVAATTIWRGLGTIDDQRETVFPEEDIGIFGGGNRAYSPKLLGALTMDAVEATFEQLPYILEAGIKALSTGVADGSGSGKIYTYPLSTNAQNTFNTYTLEGGDDQQEEETEDAFVSDFTLSGRAGEAWKVTANWLGRQVTPSTKTASLSLPTVEEILFGKSKLYIDAVSTTIGTTQKSGTLLSASLRCKTGLVAKFTADGLYFYAPRLDKGDITLEITFEHDASSVTEKAAWRAGTARQLRVITEGSALTTAGTTYTYKTMIIDVAGKWEKFDALDEQDGNDIVKGMFRVKYDSTANLAMQVVIVNQLTTIP